MSVYQTSYAVAPSTGAQRTSPGFAGIGTGVSSHRTLNPNGLLQAVAPCVVIARTCAYSAYGLPVNHGRTRLTEVAGILIGAMTVLTVFSAASESPAAGEVKDTERQNLPDVAP